MGTIVGAYAMSHVLGAAEGMEAESERVFAGMLELGRRLRATRPDLVVVLTSDHLNNFSLDAPMPFALGLDAEYLPCGDMGLPTAPVPGHAAFARGLLAHLRASDFEVGVPEALRPDHGVMIPLGIVDPERSLPMVPLYINAVFDPAPTPQASFRLGGLLRDYIRDQRPEAERVALLAGGGLSHWLGVPEEGRVNADWDRAFMARLEAGRGAELADLDNAEILAEAGNGGLEVGAWIALAGAVPGASGRALFYEAMPAWASGMGGLELDPATVRPQ